jgi:hypothetical protein
MGFVSDKGRSIPGVSAFQMHNGRIMRTSAAMFEPQDEYCAAWRLFDLLAEGAEGWLPKPSMPRPERACPGRAIARTACGASGYAPVNASIARYAVTSSPTDAQRTIQICGPFRP